MRHYCALRRSNCLPRRDGDILVLRHRLLPGPDSFARHPGEERDPPRPEIDTAYLRSSLTYSAGSYVSTLLAGAPAQILPILILKPDRGRAGGVLLHSVLDSRDTVHDPECGFNFPVRRGKMRRSAQEDGEGLSEVVVPSSRKKAGV